MYPTLDELAADLAGVPAGRRFLRFLETGPTPEHDPSLGPCILWTGCTSFPRRLDVPGKYGYGTFKVDGKMVRAHRWLWELRNGPVPEGLDLHHVCHNPRTCTLGPACPHRRCVTHVQPCTRRDNLLAGGTLAADQAARRWCKGRYGPHDLSDPNNVYIPPGTRSRHCIPCKHESQRRYQARIRAAERAAQAAARGQLTLV